MTESAPEDQRACQSVGPPTAQLTADHIKLLECARAGVPLWECLPDVICVISYLDELVAWRYLVVDGYSYSITEQGRHFLTLPLQHASLRQAMR